MELRRLKLLPLAYYKIKNFYHWLFERKDWRNAYSFLWTTLFTRDAGLAILDLLIHIFPQIAGYPKQIEIEVTTACNLKCVICEHTYWKEKAQNMTYGQFLQIMKQFPTLHWVCMTGIGSSFLNKDYMKMLEYLKKVKKSYVEFFDSFYMFDEELSYKCVELGIDKIWVSIDSPKKETYEKIRVGASFDKVVYNIKKLIEAKKRLKSPIPELWFHFIINKYNVKELFDFVDFVSEFDKMERGLSKSVLYFTNLLKFDEVNEIFVTIDNNKVKEIENYCRKRKVLYVFNQNIICNKPMSYCTKWTQPFILVTGHIQPCCAINEANARQYQIKHSFMNVFEDDFRKFWKSDKMKMFLKNLKSNKMNEICRYCPIYKHPDGLRYK
jgi:MoaA/NifB/PqqE/SkfB family radical SAM enzyme